MKRIFTILILLWGFSGFALPVKEAENERTMHQRLLNNGSMSVQSSNYGFASDMQYRHLQKLLYVSTSWISGKKQRRDELGRKLYWLTYPPSYTANTQVYEGHELWTPDLMAVQDTLTSVGFDGDSTIKELLPAYNPLLAEFSEYANLYTQYKDQDIVLQSIMGSPAPLPFDPFQSENFCFSIPQSGSFNTPGFLTHSAYFYDYCPLGSSGQRYLGGNYTNHHYPLGISVHSESYAWNIQNLDRIFITKLTVYNANAEDSIEDIAISHFMDADIGPSSWGAELAADDVSGYVKGEGHEFCYSRDQDGDGGLSLMHIAGKLIIPGFDGQQSAWFWKVGRGPDDSNPLNLSPTGRTANEKYWLGTGRNANSSYYAPLRPDNPDVTQYEQPSANDTRTLISLYGAQPGGPDYDLTDDQGNYLYRLSLPAGAAISSYTVLFAGDSIDDLKAKSVLIEDFIDNGMNTAAYQSLPCIPYLAKIQIEAALTFNINWYSYSDPDHFIVACKEYNAPASEWEQYQLSSDLRSYSIKGLDPSLWYEVKVGAVYNYDTPEELYLESDIQLVNLTYTANADDHLPPPNSELKNYPNPFRDATRIDYHLPKAEIVKLEVYNLKGQKVRVLFSGAAKVGDNSLTWDGKDERGKACASGLYYLKLQGDKSLLQRKMLLLK